MPRIMRGILKVKLIGNLSANRTVSIAFFAYISAQLLSRHQSALNELQQIQRLYFSVYNGFDKFSKFPGEHPSIFLNVLMKFE